MSRFKNKTLELGPLSYRITEPDNVWFEGKKVLGSINFEQIKIEIDKTMHDSLALYTLWHEIVHAIEDQYDLKLTEEQTDRLACGISEALRRNPWLKGLPYEQTY